MDVAQGKMYLVGKVHFRFQFGLSPISVVFWFERETRNVQRGDIPTNNVHFLMPGRLYSNPQIQG